TSEVEVVLATQCLPQKRQRDLAVNVTGSLPIGVTAKDIVLRLIGSTGTSAGQGHLVEYGGPTIRGLSMERRMTICNMSIESAAARARVPDVDSADIAIDRFFSGSRPTARPEALRAAASVIQDRHVHPKVRAMVVPGSTSVKRAAEDEGLDAVFKAAGFEWRN